MIAQVEGIARVECCSLQLQRILFRNSKILIIASLTFQDKTGVFIQQILATFPQGLPLVTVLQTLIACPAVYKMADLSPFDPEKSKITMHSLRN